MANLTVQGRSLPVGHVKTVKPGDEAATLRANGQTITNEPSPTSGNSHGEKAPKSAASVPGSAKMPAPTAPLNASRMAPTWPIFRLSRGGCLSLKAGNSLR